MVARFRTTADIIISNIENYMPCEYPPIYNIERWWHKDQFEYLAKLKIAIWAVEETQICDLLKIVFCRQVIALSNAAFNHVSTSFNGNKNDNSFTYSEGNIMFASFCDMIKNTIAVQPKESVIIYKQNSMYIPSETQECFDTIITSPPYILIEFHTFGNCAHICIGLIILKRVMMQAIWIGEQSVGHGVLQPVGCQHGNEKRIYCLTICLKLQKILLLVITNQLG